MLDALVCSIYLTYATHKPIIYQPGRFGEALSLLSDIGLTVSRQSESFSVVNSNGDIVARVCYMDSGDTAALTVEPVALIFQAFQLLGVSVDKQQKGDVLL